MKIFLQEDYYVDYSSGIIRSKASELFSENMTDLEKAKAAYSFVRDKISHSFDCDAEIITARASDVLLHKMNIMNGSCYNYES